MRAVNGYHARLCRELSKLGVLYTEEYPLGPYSVDIFLAELNRLVEVDGPSHISRKAELRRDMALQQLAPDAKIIHIRVGTPVPEAVRRMLE